MYLALDKQADSEILQKDIEILKKLGKALEHEPGYSCDPTQNVITH